MGRRATTTVLLGVVLTLLSGCGDDGCADQPVSSGIRIQVPAPIQKLVDTLRVELCQGERCEAVNFPSRATAGEDVAEGITLADDAYTIDLARLGKGWKAETVGGLTIRGTEKSGRAVVERTEQFTFTAAYPNGEDCTDDPELTYSTSVGGTDLVG